VSETLFPGLPSMERDAAISADGRYRWSLSRHWGPIESIGRRDWVGWIMLNPSTADGETDDNTIRQCIAFSRQLGGSGLAVMNLFNFRATDPEDLKKATDPIAPVGQIEHCNQLILDLWEVCPIVIAAWGTHGCYLGRDRQVYDLVTRAGRKLLCMGFTQSGRPRHPLYLPHATRPVEFVMSGGVS